MNAAKIILPWDPPPHYQLRRMITGATIIITWWIGRDSGIQTCICNGCGRSKPFPYFIKPVAKDAADLECHKGSLCNTCDPPKRWKPGWDKHGRFITPKITLRSPDSGLPLLAYDRAANRWVKIETLGVRSMTYLGTGEFRLQPQTDRRHSLRDGHEYSK